MRLENKTVAVTGAAGGLGSAIARHLAAKGAGIILLDIPSPRLDTIAAELDGIAAPVDVRDETSVATAFSAAAETAGGIDALVVTAGIQLHGEDGAAGDVPLDVWDRTIAVNLTGAFLSVKHVLPFLIQRPTSSIVLVGSPTGLSMSGAGYTAYSASKAGMMALARTVAADYASQGVRANVVVPGTMQTPLIEGLLDDPSTRAALLAGTPIGRLGRPEDLSGITEWLCSDDSSFATGGFFAVDGGLTAR